MMFRALSREHWDDGAELLWSFSCAAAILNHNVEMVTAESKVRWHCLLMRLPFMDSAFCVYATIPRFNTGGELHTIAREMKRQLRRITSRYDDQFLVL